MDGRAFPAHSSTLLLFHRFNPKSFRTFDHDSILLLFHRFAPESFRNFDHVPYYYYFTSLG